MPGSNTASELFAAGTSVIQSVAVCDQSNISQVFRSVNTLRVWRDISNFEGHDFYVFFSLIQRLGEVVIHSSYTQLDTKLDPLIDVLLRGPTYDYV
jgi:hypothetical protein